MINSIGINYRSPMSLAELVRADTGSYYCENAEQGQFSQPTHALLLCFFLWIGNQRKERTTTTVMIARCSISIVATISDVPRTPLVMGLIFWSLSPSPASLSIPFWLFLSSSQNSTENQRGISIQSFKRFEVNPMASTVMLYIHIEYSFVSVCVYWTFRLDIKAYIRPEDNARTRWYVYKQRDGKTHTNRRNTRAWRLEQRMVRRIFGTEYM